MKEYSKGLKYRSINANGLEVVGKGFCFQRSIVIPQSHRDKQVTAIGASAFENNGKLESIRIPEGVTSIGKNAFWGCSSLTSVTLPSTLESIEAGAFSGCTALAEIVIPDKVTCIGEYAFEGCEELTGINLSSVQTFGWRAFGNCVSLDHLDLSAAAEIADEAFLNCTSLKIVQEPQQDCAISILAFEGCEKRQLGKLWIGNRYVDKLRSVVFDDDNEFRNQVYMLFYDFTRTENPNQIREMFRIYREVMNEVACVGLADAHCITYLFDEDRAHLAEVLFDLGYGKALHKLMYHASKLYSYMATRATEISPQTIDRLVRRIENEPDRLRQASYVQEKAELFEQMLIRYNPHTGDIGKRVATSSVNFGGFIEEMDAVFNCVYMQIDADAEAETVKSK